MENLAVSVKLESGRIALHRGDIALMIVQNAETMGVRELEQFIQSKGLQDKLCCQIQKIGFKSISKMPLFSF